MRNLIIAAIAFASVAKSFGQQNIQVIFDFDAMNRPIAKIFPLKLVSSGDTTVVLRAQYGLENNQERFRFIFTVACQGATFFKTPDHTFLEIMGTMDTVMLHSFEEMSYATDQLDYIFVFTAGDLGYEDNDISLQRIGAISHVKIHQLPGMDLVFKLPDTRHFFLKDIQSSLRIAYRRGENHGGSNLRGGIGNTKSSRNTGK
tara:strand:- start:159 stop:764 length:606 start_codon:yes stop_codon:yes gene_type:complete